MSVWIMDYVEVNGSVSCHELNLSLGSMICNLCVSKNNISLNAFSLLVFMHFIRERNCFTLWNIHGGLWSFKMHHFHGHLEIQLLVEVHS